MELGNWELIWMAENNFPESFEMWLRRPLSEAQTLESSWLFIEEKKKKKEGIGS